MFDPAIAARARAVGLSAAVLLASGAALAHAAPLPALLVDASQTTVSGLSSGGYMAVQMHVAYSATFHAGAGIVAGGPYYCAQDSLLTATGPCMAHDQAIPVAALVATTKSWASAGSIDPVSNLANSKVYLYSGTQDLTVVPAVMADLKTYYASFVPAANIVYKKNLGSGHGMVTDDFGGSCATTASPYIDDCHFDLAGAILQQLYGPLGARNAGALSGDFVEFDQTPYVKGHGMADTGWLYVPAACSAGEKCRLHVAFHGCLQNSADLGVQFVRDTGYNRWADTNHIVVLYPQTSTAATNGCWDWWGYDSASYAKKSGPQMAGVKAMVDRLSSGVPPAPPASVPAPAGITASGATSTSMKLAWNPVAGAAGYDVWRGPTLANATRLTSTAFTDTGLASGTTYHWNVRAVDATGAHGAVSVTAAGSTTGSAPACFTDSNYDLTVAGRAYTLFGIAYAAGSNELMGPWNIYVNSTLKQTGPGSYIVATCP
jgi:poly(3-hydroxybutyrate) depolymerase